MKTTKLWTVELTMPPVAPRTWSTNQSVHIAADTLEDALAIARRTYPDTRFWKVMHQGDLHLVNLPQ